MKNINKMTKSNMTVKQKPKELDWAEFLKQMGWDKPYTFTLEKQRVKSLLTQQRTELLEEILDENFCDLDGTYDYDGIAESVIKLAKKL